LQIAIKAGWAILEQGGAALDAAEAAIRALEDDPSFNADG
jgi:beta-aspartyl-peptidase (threonine type)